MVILIMNGYSRAGKDSVFHMLLDNERCNPLYIDGKKWDIGIRKTSTVEWCKVLYGKLIDYFRGLNQNELADYFSAQEVEKTPLYRSTLVDLKKTFDKHYDLSTKAIIERAKYYQKSSVESDRYTTILTVDIREPENIDKIKNAVANDPEIADKIKVYTLKVERNGIKPQPGDEHVDNYNYDYYIRNDSTINELFVQVSLFWALSFKGELTEFFTKK